MRIFNPQQDTPEVLRHQFVPDVSLTAVTAPLYAQC